ncbi:MAG: 4-phosphoerythronate dehydrogenase [Bacteroidales bacterium]|nr:4-phosphoerythronate dehydrogenase [Bacteroidales bacterium]
MKFVVDSHIPFIQGVFEPYAEVVYINGSEILHEDIIDADALIIRTRTRCNAEFLQGSSVRLISTATIGTDHIDLPWCAENGITVANAAGCNAGGVMNYVFSSLYGMASRKSRRLDDATFGIIGVGHVGSLVERTARKLGFNVILCDPPRAAAEGEEKFSSLDYLLENSDIVTLHTPLDENTLGMADEDFFEKIRPGAFFINSSRGEVVKESALLHAAPKLGAIIIDTWCNEPDINLTLMDRADIATPHIAGYSYQGKQNGTSMAVRAVAKFFGIKALEWFYPPADEPMHNLGPMHLDVSGKNQGEIASLIQYNYPVFTDDFMFRTNPTGFESLRSNYRYRREFYI